MQSFLLDFLFILFNNQDQFYTQVIKSKDISATHPNIFAYYFLILYDLLLFIFFNIYYIFYSTVTKKFL